MKVIFSDIDGTIIPFGRKGFLKEEIEFINKNSDRIVLVTGRPYSAISNIEELNCKIVSSNGSYMGYDNEYVEIMETEEILNYVINLKEKYGDDVFILLTGNKKSHLFSGDKEKMLDFPLGDIQGDNTLSLEELKEQGILKVSLFGTREKMDELMEKEEFTGKNNNYSFLRTHELGIDLNRKDTDKRIAIKKYKAVYGDCYAIAVGDGANDIPMLDEADCAIVIDNNRPINEYATKLIKEGSWIKEIEKELNCCYEEVKLEDLIAKHTVGTTKELEYLTDWGKKVNYPNTLWGTARGITETAKEKQKRELAYIEKMVANKQYNRPIKIVKTSNGNLWSDNTHSTIMYIIRNKDKLKEVPYYVIDFDKQGNYSLYTNTPEVTEESLFFPELVERARLIENREKIKVRDFDWKIKDLVKELNKID